MNRCVLRVKVSVIGTSKAPKAFKPEIILKDDKFTCDFSPLDVRSLTYLGYCNLNAPRYKLVIEKKNNDNEVLYVVSVKGEKHPKLIKEEDIISNPDIYNEFSAEDAAKISKAMEERATNNDLESLKKFKSKNNSNNNSNNS